MATYLELYNERDNDDLRRRIETALIIKAQVYLDAGNPTQTQRAWAKAVFADGHSESLRMLKYLLAKNKDSTLAAIQAVTDAALTTQINAVADQFVAAYAGT